MTYWRSMSLHLTVLMTMLLGKVCSFTPVSRSARLGKPAPTITIMHTRLYAGTRAKRRKLKTTDDSGPLTWEKFDFGDSPKWDQRFDASSTVVASNEEELEAIRQKEAIHDKEAAKKLNSQYEAWQRIDPEIVQRAIATLRPYVNDDRVNRIETVLKQRTRHTRFLFENPVNPSNVWACLRTMDSFGIQYVDLVINSGKYKGKAAISQKRGMRTAMGSAQWLTLRNHASTAEAIQTLKQEGFLIYASDLNPTSIDVREMDWSAGGTPKDDEERPICIVMGNEDTGISQEMRDAAYATFTLPMCGFAESFNLSVATAITLAHLSAVSSSPDEKGPLRPGDLDSHEYDSLFLKGLMNSIPQHRMTMALLKQEGIELPDDVRKL